MQNELVGLLTTLRRERRQQSGLRDGLSPPDTVTAYRLAGEVAQRLGWAVGGWKIAAIKEEMQRALRTDAPICGRDYRQFITSSATTLKWSTLLRPLAEIKYAVRLGTDLPPRTYPYSEDEVADAVSSIHPGLEIAECSIIRDMEFIPNISDHRGRQRRRNHYLLAGLSQLAHRGHRRPGGCAHREPQGKASGFSGVLQSGPSRCRGSRMSCRVQASA